MVEELDQELEQKIQQLTIRNILIEIGYLVDILQHPEVYGIGEKGIRNVELELQELHNQLPL